MNNKEESVQEEPVKRRQGRPVQEKPKHKLVFDNSKCVDEDGQVQWHEVYPQVVTLAMQGCTQQKIATCLGFKHYLFKESTKQGDALQACYKHGRDLLLSDLVEHVIHYAKNDLKACQYALAAFFKVFDKQPSEIKLNLGDLTPTQRSTLKKALTKVSGGLRLLGSPTEDEPIQEETQSSEYEFVDEGRVAVQVGSGDIKAVE